MLKIITVKETVERLGKAGLHTNVQRIQEGLKQGVYPFGVAIKLKEYVFEVYSKSLEDWIRERSDD